MTLRPYWLALGWAMVAAVCWLSLASAPLDTGIDHGDKVGHLLAYLGLMAWWGQLDSRSGRLLLLFLCMGAGLEGLQGLTPMRQPSLMDMLANASGAILGWLTAHTHPHWLADLERRFVS
jgi:VanZ family protein